MRRQIAGATFALLLGLAGRGIAAADDTGPAAAPAPASDAPDPAERAKWGAHMGDLPFVVGFEKGTKAAAASGRQPMYFFTATW
jgi:hypothetical protein